MTPKYVVSARIKWYEYKSKKFNQQYANEGVVRQNMSMYYLQQIVLAERVNALGVGTLSIQFICTPRVVGWSTYECCTHYLSVS